jgi:hypothetical protein
MRDAVPGLVGNAPPGVLIDRAQIIRFPLFSMVPFIPESAQMPALDAMIGDVCRGGDPWRQGKPRDPRSW